MAPVDIGRSVTRAWTRGVFVLTSLVHCKSCMIRAHYGWNKVIEDAGDIGPLS